MLETIGLIGNFSILPVGDNLCIFEFAKLRAFAPSCLTCLTHAPYLRALRTFFKCLAGLICVT